MSRVVGNVHGHMILCHMVLTRDPVMTIFGELLMCVQVVVTCMHVRQVSVLPPGIDVRKLQRSHSELRVEPLSGLPSRLFFGLPIRFSVFTQTLSDLTLDWSKVSSDKLLCVNTALVYFASVRWRTLAEKVYCIAVVICVFKTLLRMLDNLNNVI